MSKPATLCPRKRTLTETIGVVPVTSEEAANLAGPGFTAFESALSYCTSSPIFEEEMKRDR